MLGFGELLESLLAQHRLALAKIPLGDRLTEHRVAVDVSVWQLETLIRLVARCEGDIGLPK